MIATHDTLTYLQPLRWWWRPFSPWWRTQSRSVTQQLADGVRYFDIRMRYDSRGNPIFCHGLVDFPDAEAMAAVRTILRNPSVRYRIILERGDTLDEIRFRMDIFESLANGKLQGLDKLIIKKKWRIVWSAPGKPITVYDLTRPALLSDRPWWKQPLGLLRALIPIRRWVSRHNPGRDFTANAWADGNTAFFLDYYEYTNGRKNNESNKEQYHSI